MIKKIKNKFQLNTKSKILVLGLILIVLVGLFSPMARVKAQGATGTPTTLQACTYRFGGANQVIITNAPCVDGSGTPQGSGTPTAPATPTPAGQSAFDIAVGENTCVLSSWTTGTLGGCILQFLYWTFYTLGGWLLAIAASFFNFFIKITLGSELLKSSFISTAWGVVRDLSNIFFILILLYIAIKIILDLGGSEAKKMIAKVIIMALLINFSMFMTHVIIDASNIMALIFYNKINTVDKNTANPNLAASLIDYATGEKDLAGGLTQSFNPVYKLDSKFFTEAAIIKIPGQPDKKEPISTGTLIGITVIAGGIMLFAAYALFISALSFLGRLIELFVLIIFSPFAFMSWSIPELKNKDYLGWDSWLKRLLSVSFMAPIFMFFLYFIFLLLGKDMFTDSIKASIKGEGTVHTLLSIMIPALIILLLLIKATSFAKKGSGQFGEAIIKGGTMVAGVAGGLALGAATGGAAMALRAGVGGGGGLLANKSASLANRIGATKFGGAVGFNKLASGLTSVDALAQRSSFDLRAGGGLAKATGLNLGQAQKGGIAQSRKEKVEKRMKRAEGLKVREDEGLKQNLNKAEMALQELLNQTTKDFEEIDRKLKSWREKKADSVTGSVDNLAAAAEIKALRARKKDIKDGLTGVKTKDGKTINNLEDDIIPDAKVAIETENRRRTVAFANRKGGWGVFSSTANKDARHKVIMESKIESKGEAH